MAPSGGAFGAGFGPKTKGRWRMKMKKVFEVLVAVLMMWALAESFVSAIR